MAGPSDALERCRTHNRILAEFGRHALSECDLASLLDEACELAAGGTGVTHAKVLRYRPERDDLLIVAGLGWRTGVIGTALPAGMRSPAGRCIRNLEPVSVADLPSSSEYEYHDVLREHGILSLLDVPIAFETEAWGVFEVDSERSDGAASQETPFLMAFANLIAHAIRQRSIAAERAALSLDREVLLRKRDVLFRELHHRVNNNFHAIAGLIEMEARRVPPEARQGFEKLAARVASIIDAHEHLAAHDVARNVSLSFYLENLVSALHGPDNVAVVRRIAPATVPLRVAVRLGMIVNEMATNSFKHAFSPERGGTVEVRLDVDAAAGTGRLVVADDGKGLAPETRRRSGLALVESLVEQIGGRLERTNRTGGGLKSAIVFPLNGGDQADSDFLPRVA
ncbi:MAG: GAF domain-containing protein [Rhodospirillales bacterium]|nr:GAF domain-containing protein [Rhodospirillales bacterium]